MDLPVGFYKFSKKPFINYQLNRWHSLGYTRKEEIEEAGRRIKKIDDNKIVFQDLAGRALKEKRLKNAAFYYRAAEFLTSPYDPDKKMLYNAFSDTFYKAFQEEHIERFKVPYEDGYLSAMKLTPDGKSKGVVVIHGGFDSFIEAFFSMWKSFALNGYTVIAFDGPGQGATLMNYAVPHTHDWEKPVSAILDYFDEDDVTLQGFSFGGYWCVRAAAFEKRVKRLIINAPLYDLLEGISPLMRSLVTWMMKREKFINANIRFRMKLLPVIKHVVHQCLHITKNIDAQPVTAAQWLLSMNKNHIHSELVDQDVFIMGGEKDKFQSLRLFHKQKEALVNARSVTPRIFTREENAENHCQMGNLALAYKEMNAWLDKITGNA